MTIEQEIIAILNQIPTAIEKAFTEVFVQRHPGHPNQKTHGNRFGVGQAKESFRRLKDDKGARERYKATARKKQGLGVKPERKPGKMEPKTPRKGPFKAGQLKEGDKYMDTKKGVTTIKKVHPFNPKYPKSQLIDTDFGRVDFDPDRIVWLTE